MDKIRLESEFKKAGIGIPFRLYGSLDSTNTLAKTLEPPCIVIALRQTAGRGRGGKAFESPAGGLYFSILLKRDLFSGDGAQDLLNADKAALYPLICGIAVAECAEGAKVKWPNDIYLSGGGNPEKYFKIAGILCEASGDKFIIGAGLNVNTKDFPAGLRDKASSMALLRGKEYGMEETAAKVIGNVLRHINDGRYFSDGGFLTGRFAEYDYLKGRKVTVKAGKEQAAGLAAGIDAQGRLKLLCGQGIRLFNCGEIIL